MLVKKISHEHETTTVRCCIFFLISSFGQFISTIYHLKGIQDTGLEVIIYSSSYEIL